MIALPPPTTRRLRRQLPSRLAVLTLGLWACTSGSTALADVVLYRLPGTPLVFVLEGRTQANPGRTLTVRHKLGTLYLGLDDVRTIKTPPPRSIAETKLRSAVSKGDAGQCIKAARWSLHNGLLPEFYEALSAGWKLNPDHPTVLRLARMRQRINVPIADSTEQRRELSEFTRNRGDMEFAESKHFVLLHDTGSQRVQGRLTRAQQRLALLETVYESFLMKFSLEGIDLIVPRQRMKVVLFSERSAYLQFVTLLGPELSSAAGFFDRRANVSVFYDQGTNDSFKVLSELNAELQQDKQEALRTRRPGAREIVRLADTLQLLTAISRENQDVEVVSHEATHQLAGNTGLMPADAPVPVWAAEGLATYFESPREAAWSGIGAVNEQRLDWYRELEPDREHSNIPFIVSDQIFTLARTQEGSLHAYGQAWALTHFLMERHFDRLIQWYGLIARRKQDEALSPQQLLASFNHVFGANHAALEREWREYMRTLKTDLQQVLEEQSP